MSVVARSAQSSQDPASQCEYWLEMMQRHREPRYTTCIKQYKQIVDSSKPKSLQRRALADLIKVWEKSNLLSDLMSYAQNLTFISALSSSASKGQNAFCPTLSSHHSTHWITELALTSQEMQHFETVANQVAVSHSSFASDNQYESNLVPFGELSDIELAQMASFTKAVAANQNVLLTWESHYCHGQDLHHTVDKSAWFRAFEQIPAFVWKSSATIGNILIQSGFDLFPVSGHTNQDVPELYHTFAFCIIVGCIPPQSARHEHPLWQCVALEALRRDDTDLIGLLTSLCSVSLMQVRHNANRNGLLHNSMALKKAAAWLIYQSIFVLPDPTHDALTVAPKTLALFLSSAGKGWTSPAFVRVIYPSYQTSELFTQQMTAKNCSDCCWCNLAASDPSSYALQSTSGTLPQLVSSIINQTVEYGTSVFHECAPMAIIPASIIAKCMSLDSSSGDSQDLGNIALHFPHWIGVGMKRGQFILVPAQQLFILGESTVGKQHAAMSGAKQAPTTPSSSSSPLSRAPTALASPPVATADEPIQKPFVSPKKKRLTVMLSTKMADPNVVVRRSSRHASREAASAISVIVQKKR